MKKKVVILFMILMAFLILTNADANITMKEGNEESVVAKSTEVSMETMTYRAEESIPSISTEKSISVEESIQSISFHSISVGEFSECTCDSTRYPKNATARDIMCQFTNKGGEQNCADRSQFKGRCPTKAKTCRFPDKKVNECTCDLYARGTKPKIKEIMCQIRKDRGLNFCLPRSTLPGKECPKYAGIHVMTCKVPDKKASKNNHGRNTMLEYFTIGVILGIMIIFLFVVCIRPEEQHTDTGAYQYEEFDTTV